MSGCEYSQDRDTPAVPATPAKVTAMPARSSSRIAWIALARASSCRRRLAAAMIGAVLSGRIGVFVLVIVGLQRRDDLFEVAGDLPVHLDHACLAAGFGRGDDLERDAVLGPVLGQELGRGDEERAGQAGVGVRAGLDQWQAAEAVGQCLCRAAQALFGPGGLGERPAGVQRDGIAAGVDLAGGLPVPADGG